MSAKAKKERDDSLQSIANAWVKFLAKTSQESEAVASFKNFCSENLFFFQRCLHDLELKNLLRILIEANVKVFDDTSWESTQEVLAVAVEEDSKMKKLDTSGEESSEEETAEEDNDSDDCSFQGAEEEDDNDD